MQNISFLSAEAPPSKITKKRRVSQLYDSDVSDYNSSIESAESDEVASSLTSSPCSSPIHIAKKFKPNPQEFVSAFSSSDLPQFTTLPSATYLNPTALYATPNSSQFYNPNVLTNITLLNPADFAQTAHLTANMQYVVANGLHSSDNATFNTTTDFSTNMNYIFPNEVLLIPSAPENAQILDMPNFVTYEDIINELFS